MGVVVEREKASPRVLIIAQAGVGALRKSRADIFMRGQALFEIEKTGAKLGHAVGAKRITKHRATGVESSIEFCS
jgi:hypothetical protein